MSNLTSSKTRASALIPAAALVVAAAIAVTWGCGGADPSRASAEETAGSVRVSFHEDAGTEDTRILNLGGLVIRASCIDYGQGREYLAVAAKTTINDAARALVLSQRRGGEAQTSSFKSSDFDRDFGWYDITGTNPHDTTGTFSYARPDRGQVTLTFRADQDTADGDCAFDGVATYLP